MRFAFQKVSNFSMIKIFEYFVNTFQGIIQVLNELNFEFKEKKR
jgi:hypothetical protein